MPGVKTNTDDAGVDSGGAPVVITPPPAVAAVKSEPALKPALKPAAAKTLSDKRLAKLEMIERAWVTGVMMRKSSDDVIAALRKIIEMPIEEF